MDARLAIITVNELTVYNLLTCVTTDGLLMAPLVFLVYATKTKGRCQLELI